MGAGAVGWQTQNRDVSGVRGKRWGSPEGVVVLGSLEDKDTELVS